MCCTALMRPNQAEPVLSAVAHSLVPHAFIINPRHACAVRVTVVVLSL